MRLCAVRRVAGDGAAVHIECAAHTHAAAAARYVVGDLAAVHIEYAAFADIHAAAGYSFSALIVAGDAAAVHIECAAHTHTGEVVRFIGLDIKAVGDLTLFSRRFAVGQGKGPVGLHDDGVNISIRRDAVAVQAQHHAVCGRPCCGKRHIAGQVVVARLGDFIQTVNARPCLSA